VAEPVFGALLYELDDWRDRDLSFYNKEVRYGMRRSSLAGSSGSI
jgi:hypothetical protein